MKRMIAWLLLLTLVISSLSLSTFAAQNEPTEAELPKGVSPYELPEDTARPATRSAKRDTLPTSYNSNKLGYITPVRSQSPYATCWAHGNIGACEASMIRNGVTVGNTGKAATTALNLSEYHISWFSATNSYDALGMLTGDSAVPVNSFLDGAGNDTIATYTLMRWEGLGSEETPALAYGNTSEKGLDPSYAYNYNVAHVQDAIWIPTSNRDAVKQAIMLCGGGTISYYHENASANYISGAYCYNGTEAANHDVLVVGWDDDYSRTKFKNVPEGDGAWIIKGSWGTRLGDKGYFYISYYDTTSSKGSCCFYNIEPVDNYDFNYQYDGTPNSSYLSKKSGISVSNVFTSNGMETLEAVAAANLTAGLPYTLKIYKEVTSTTNPTRGTLAATQTGTFTYKGYHTVKLKKPITLKKGERFSVVFTFTGNDTIQIPVDKSGSNSWMSWTHATHPNTSYFKSGSANAWTNYSATGNFRIKAYTKVAHPTITASSSGTDKGTVVLNGSVITAKPADGYYASGYTVLEGKATVTRDGNKFTVDTEESCAIRINFEAKAAAVVSYYVNGSTQKSLTASLGDTVTLPQPETIPEGYDFSGWATKQVRTPETSRPTVYAAGSRYTITSTSTKLYALFAFAQNDEGKRVGTFTAVTETPKDWSGDYIIATATGICANDICTDNYLGCTTLTVKDNSITTTDASVIWTIDEVDNTNTYTIQNSEGKYLSSSATRNVHLVDEADSYCYWKLEPDKISTAATAFGNLLYNKTLPRFTTYSTAQTAIRLYAGESGAVYYTTDAQTETAHVHTLVATSAKAATCTTDGNKAYWRCSECGMYFADAKATIETTLAAMAKPATGHDLLYAQNGDKHTVTCSRCKYKTTENHSYKEGSCICGATEAKDYCGRYYIAALRSGDKGIYHYMTSDTASSRYVIVSSKQKTLPSTISVPDANKVFVISKAADGGYLICAEGRKEAGYLSWGKGNTGSYSAKGSTVTITDSTNNSVQVKLNGATDGTRYLAFSSSASSKYAAWYKSGAKNLYLIPVTGTATHTHSYTSKVKAPTCTVAGYTTYTCSCGSSYTADRVAALGHDLQYRDLGTSHKTTCSRCSYSKTATHSYVNGVCVCGATKEIDFSGRYYIAALRSGDNGNYQYLTDTVTNNRYTIVASGLTKLPEKITAPESGRVFVIKKLTGGGYSLASETRTSEKYLSWTSGNTGTFSSTAAPVTISAGTNGTVLIKLNSTTDGTRYLAFNSSASSKYAAWYKSGAKNLYLIPVTGTVNAHTHSYTATVVAATCTEKGYELHTCSCGESYKDNYVEALGHELTYKQTATGHKESCTRCSYSATVRHLYTAGVCACGATDYSGTYYIAGVRSGDSGVYQYLTSDLSKNRYVIESSGVKELPTSVTASEKNKTFIISKNPDDTYTILAGNGQYLSWTSGNTGVLSTTARKVNIVQGSNGTVLISLASCADGPRYLAFNSTASNKYAAWYKNGVKNLKLIPVATRSMREAKNDSALRFSNGPARTVRSTLRRYYVKAQLAAKYDELYLIMTYRTRNGTTERLRVEMGSYIARYDAYTFACSELISNPVGGISVTLYGVKGGLTFCGETIESGSNAIRTVHTSQHSGGAR